MRGPVVAFPVRPPPGDLRTLQDRLTEVLGRLTPLADVLLLQSGAGTIVTNAAASPGTTVAGTQVWIDLADSGADQARVVARANAGAAGTVYVTVYSLTQSAEVARVAVVDAADQTVAGEWTRLQPSGGDEELVVRVLGDGVLDPVLSRVSLQLRTLGVGP
jgi:hypothetical protein